MKKVVIIGAGISGLTAGIYLQKAGIPTEIYEKNQIPGGQCTGWKREGYFIDNCIHWLTGTREGSGLHELWKEVGALGQGVELYHKEKFYTSELDGETLTLWRDKERTRLELLALSPEDQDEINKLMDAVLLAESMTVPVDKSFDMMNPIEFLIRQALIDYMPPGYQAYAFVVSYATVTSGNGDIPRGGSLQMVLRMVKRYEELGGKLHTGAEVEKVLVNGKRAEGIKLTSGDMVKADYVICASDVSHTFGRLLDEAYMPKQFRKLYQERELYPVISGFHVAFGVEGNLPDAKETNVFPCRPVTIGTSVARRMSINNYSYEPEFAPEGHTILQSNFVQTEEDYAYWMRLYEDKKAYESRKRELSEEILQRLLDRYPDLAGKVKILDVWTPATYYRYCYAYHGAYMGFIETKKAKNHNIPGKVKDLSNVMLASQWLMGAGGLPTAAAMGKFAAQRILSLW